MNEAAISLVTPKEMATVDCAAISSGLDGYRLMEAAGAALAACVLRHYASFRNALVLCGPGNNGGDGYVAARHLRAAGMAVTVQSLLDPIKLSGDAALARDDWSGPIEALATAGMTENTIVVDALFGGGLDRPIAGVAADTIAAINGAGLPVVAADLPSGISGSSGTVLGTALEAAHTVTFVAPKPGHYLLPGRAHCGTLHVVDIGIPRRFVEALQSNLWLNGPAVWGDQLPVPHGLDHKYTRGHLCVFSGAYPKTGAARMAAAAGLRAGAGLVTILSPGAAIAANAAHLTAVMLRRVDDEKDLAEVLDDERLNAYVLGPAFGVGDRARHFVERITGAKRALVLDADGLTAFAGGVDTLRDACENAPVVITPHNGEFARLFPDLVSNVALSKVDRARTAAEWLNAVVLYKGADTVVAAPDGRAVVNANAPPWLATAGSGDCLAGIVGALLAQGMPPFEATAAAVFMHGEAGRLAGEGLTAEDISTALPALSAMRHKQQGV